MSVGLAGSAFTTNIVILYITFGFFVGKHIFTSWVSNQGYKWSCLQECVFGEDTTLLPPKVLSVKPVGAPLFKAKGWTTDQGKSIQGLKNNKWILTTM